MASASNWMLSLKLLFVSTGILVIALGLKVSVPLVLEFFVSQAPLWWITFRSCLKPPYLYVLVNGIIITIAASSWFQQNNSDKDHNTEQMQQPQPKISVDQKLVLSEYDSKNSLDTDVVESIDSVYEQIQRGKEVETRLLEESNVAAVEDYSEIPPEKPTPSSRFGHRKLVKANPEGRQSLRVAKPKRHETLENTWKMITEGKTMPLSRHLKKSDTWENHGRDINIDALTDSPLMKKSETFRDRTNYQRPPAVEVSSFPASGKLRKEPSLSQDELNRRVEAFINKFNDDMRLQKQESINQYMEMINRGS